MKLSEIARFLELEFKDEDREISRLDTLADANKEALTFLDNSKYQKQLETTQAGAVLVSPDLVHLVPKGTIALTTKEPYLKLAYATKLFAPQLFKKEGKAPIIGKNCHISKQAYIGFDTKIGDNVTIMPFSFIGDGVEIGSDTIIHPNVTIYHDCVIGKNCIVHSSAVIGSDGFGFAHTKAGEHIKIYQNGNVVIEDDVEIGSNTSIDRAVFRSTRIAKGSKLDNLIQIGHNCQIGEGCIIVSSSAIAGSSEIGHHSVFGGQTGVVGHVKIAPFTTVASRGAIMSDIKESGKTWAGFPQMELKEWLKMSAKIKALIKPKK